MITDEYILLSQADIDSALMLVYAVCSAYAWQECQFTCSQTG